MKNFTSGKMIFCALSLCALFGATAAQAQNYSVRVDVPFQFIAGEKLYPAGDYKFTVDDAVNTLKIEAHDRNRINMVRLAPGTDRRPNSERERGMVRFTKAGTVHVLSGVWKAGAVDGNTTYPSRAAKEAVKAGNITTEIPAGN